MEIVIHRVNSVAKLAEVPVAYGAEIDIRASGSKLILNHEPFAPGDSLEDYLSVYRHGLLVLNVKEAGIEDEVLRLARSHNVNRFFLLDVEFPYIYQASRKGEKSIAMRYSEDESIETALNYTDKVDWVWIDVNTRLPLDGMTTQKLKPFKSCLVCPERWGRSRDIKAYAGQMRELNFWPDAVMTAEPYAKEWIAQAGLHQ